MQRTEYVKNMENVTRKKSYGSPLMHPLPSKLSGNIIFKTPDGQISGFIIMTK